MCKRSLTTAKSKQWKNTQDSFLYPRTHGSNSTLKNSITTVLKRESQNQSYSGRYCTPNTGWGLPTCSKTEVLLLVFSKLKLPNVQIDIKTRSSKWKLTAKVHHHHTLPFLRELLPKTPWRLWNLKPQIPQLSKWNLFHFWIGASLVNNVPLFFHLSNEVVHFCKTLLDYLSFLFLNENTAYFRFVIK